MLDIKDIEKLAKLARIELTNDQKQRLLKEVDPILDYVTQLKEVVSKIGEAKVVGELRNVVRDDVNPTETSTNTKNIIADMPNSQDDYLKVEKIL